MFKSVILVVSLFFFMSGCSESEQVSQSEMNTFKEVYTVNYPLYYFAERMAPAGVEVIFPVPSGIDPAFWAPKAEEVLRFAEADLIIINGADYAKWLRTASLPASKVVNTSRSFDKELIHIESADHTHGPAGEHSHAGTAFTTWLDMQQAIQQAEAIKNALARLEPEQRAAIQASFLELKQELQQLDTAFKEAVKGQQTTIIASHPVYQYFARRYGLDIHALLWEPEMTIDSKAQAEIRTLLAKHPTKVMIWEGEPTAENAAYIESLGLQNIVVEPGMNRPEKGDFVSLMQRNVQKIKEAF